MLGLFLEQMPPCQTSDAKVEEKRVEGERFFSPEERSLVYVQFNFLFLPH